MPKEDIVAVRKHQGQHGCIMVAFPADDAVVHKKLKPKVPMPKVVEAAAHKVEAAAEQSIRRVRSASESAISGAAGKVGAVAAAPGKQAKRGLFGRRGQSPPVKLTDVLAALEEVREMKAKQNAEMQQKIDRLQAEQARRAAR